MLALCGAVQAAPAQERGQVVQDGIAVTPLWVAAGATWGRQKSRSTRPAASAVCESAGRRRSKKGALVPAIRSAGPSGCAPSRKGLIPQTARWNPARRDWQWEVNLLGPPTSTHSACRAASRVLQRAHRQAKLTDDEIAGRHGPRDAHALREHGRERMTRARRPAWSPAGRRRSVGVARVTNAGATKAAASWRAEVLARGRAEADRSAWTSPRAPATTRAPASRCGKRWRCWTRARAAPILPPTRPARTACSRSRRT